jgi:hypothetical protein
MNSIAKIAKATLLLCLLVLGHQVLAAGVHLPEVVIKKLDNSRKVSVEIHNLKQEAIIRFTNANGQTLFEQKAPADNPRYARVFNLINLPDGEYYFIIATELKETVQPVQLTTNDIVINDFARTVHLTPMIMLGEEYVDVNWFNGRVGNLSFEIHNAAGAVIFSDKMKNVVKVERRYNIALLDKGEYQVVVNTPYKTYYKSLVVK